MNLLKRLIGSKKIQSTNAPLPTGVLRLELHAPPDYTPQLIALEPDAAVIKDTIHAQPWDDITFVVLCRDAESGIELSGSLSPADGLSARYWENGREFVSVGAPSLQQGIEFLQFYSRGDERWRSVVRWR